MVEITIPLARLVKEVNEYLWAWVGIAERTAEAGVRAFPELAPVREQMSTYRTTGTDCATSWTSRAHLSTPITVLRWQTEDRTRNAANADAGRRRGPPRGSPGAQLATGVVAELRRSHIYKDCWRTCAKTRTRERNLRQFAGSAIGDAGRGG
jgi:hypothetical protein